VRRGAIAALAALTAGFFSTAVKAGAWPMPKGEGQVILKYERMEADEAFDLDGSVVPLFPRTDETLSAWVEYGLTRRITLQAQAAYTQGEDPFIAYDGRGPTQLGVRATVLQTRRTVVSVYAGGTLAGEGRNADFAAPSQGDGDLELRLLAGRSGVWRRRSVFVEGQVARLARSGLPDETRIETALGIDVTPRWQLLVQTYGGRADGGDDAPLWTKGEVSLVRRAGPWRFQAGWRHAYAGRNVPLERGPVLAVWRTF
jgi:hypothetical protein